MAGEEKNNPQAAAQSFGNCCTELKEALEGDDFDPFMTVAPDGVLYMTVGMIEMDEDDEPGFVDHPMFFCPFCGTRLQTAEDVRSRVGGEAVN